MPNSQGFFSTAMGGPEDDSVNPANSGIPLVEGGNPAWNDVLQYVPEDKRQEVVPRLQEWDKNYQEVQQQLAPWKEFVDSKVDPETAQLGLNVLTTIENNPQAAYDAIGKHLGISSKEAKEVVQDVQKDIEAGQDSSSGISKEQFEQLKKTTDAMAQILVANRQQEEINQEEQALDQELSALKKNKGDFPEEEIVMRMLHLGLNAEEAYDHYAQFEENLFKSRKQAPRVLSGGGQVPQPHVKVTELDRKGTKDYVAQMLTQAAQQNQ